MGTIGGPQVGYIYEDAFRELYAEKSVEAEADPAEAAPEGPAQSCIRAGCGSYFYWSMVKPNIVVASINEAAQDWG